ncbi:hypothetical protein chiPu_0022680, partial [Chiloscyllium punctatum]|nr:hypothetical protein [Chiloscyllium punctatum]
MLTWGNTVKPVAAGTPDRSRPSPSRPWETGSIRHREPARPVWSGVCERA